MIYKQKERAFGKYSEIKKSIIIKAGAEIRTRVPGSTVPEDDHLPYPGIESRIKKLLKCGSRDSNPGRPASTGPKPVPFGLSGTPAYENKGYIETIKNLNKSFKMLRPGFEPESSARKAEMIGRTTPPEHTNTNEFQLTWAQWGSNP